MRETLIILTFFLLTSGVNAQKDSIDITQFDSTIQVSKIEPLNLYQLIYKDGKCGLLVENKMVLPIIYNSKYLKFEENGSVAILTDKEPFTIFFPKDSTSLNIETKNGILINDDSLYTGFTIINLLDGRTIIEIRRIHKNLDTANSIFPSSLLHGYNTFSEIYYIEKERGGKTTCFSEVNSRFIPLGDIVVGLKPKNKAKEKYLVTLYKSFEGTELISYKWSYNIDNPMIESTHYEFKEKMYYKFWYLNSKDKKVDIGFVSLPEWIFIKKIK